MSDPAFRVALRPQCQLTGWLMGEDYEFLCSADVTSFDDIAVKINEMRPHILQSRINFYYKDKLIPENKMKWSLKRNGISKDEIIVISPTSYNGWYWHTMEYYQNNLLKNIALDILKSSSAMISLDEIHKKYGEICKPIKTKVKVLIKSYPERFFTRTDVTTGMMWVAISTGWQLPSYEQSPVDMGVLQQYNPKSFDWADYMSVDSMARVKVSINAPATPYRFQVIGFTRVKLMNPLKKPNCYCKIFWNNDAIEEGAGAPPPGSGLSSGHGHGHGRVKHDRIDNFASNKTFVMESEIMDDSYSPTWTDLVFTCETGELGDMEICAMKLEIYSANFDESIEANPDGSRNTDFDELVGRALISGSDLELLVQKKCNASTLFEVQSVVEEDDNDYQYNSNPDNAENASANGEANASVSGASASASASKAISTVAPGAISSSLISEPVGYVLLHGTRNVGFEVCVVNVFDIIEFREHNYQHALVVAYWNGEEIGATPPSLDNIDPGWMLPGRKGEVFSFAVPDSKQVPGGIKACSLELQLWLTDANGGRGNFLGACIHSGRKLMDLLSYDPETKVSVGTTRTQHALQESYAVNIPRELRGPSQVFGSMNIIAGPPGLHEEVGKCMAVYIDSVLDTAKMNFIVVAAYWNNWSLGTCAPSRMEDQDWKHSKCRTIFRWSRSGLTNKGEFYFHLPAGSDHLDGDGNELKLAVYALRYGENYINLDWRRAVLSTDPQGKAFVVAGQEEMMDATANDENNNNNTHGNDAEGQMNTVGTILSRRKNRPVEKPKIAQFLGQILLKDKDLLEMFEGGNQKSKGSARCAKKKTFELKMDYKHDEMYSRAFNPDSTMTIICGEKGSRIEAERVFTIDVVTQLNLYGKFIDVKKQQKAQNTRKGSSLSFLGLGKKEDAGDDNSHIEGDVTMGNDIVALLEEGKPVDIFVLVFWNNVEVGRSSIVTTTTGDVVFSNEHFYVPLTAPAADDEMLDMPGAPPVGVSHRKQHKEVANTFSCTLDIEVLDNREASLGCCKMDGRKVGAFLESKTPTSMSYDLSVSTRFSSHGRKVVKGQMKLSTPGLAIASPYNLDAAKAAKKAREEAAQKKAAERAAKALKKAEAKAAKKEAKKKAKKDAKAALLAKEAAMSGT